MKKNIAILFGGDSSEKIISERSSVTIEKHIPKDKYNVYKVSVVGAEWLAYSHSGETLPVNKNDFSFSSGGEKINFDFAFIIIHGTPGENGLLQAYFELVGVPYSTCDSFVSALTFDKYACKCYLRDSGINMAGDFLLKKDDDYSINEIETKLGYPVFVKPNAGGSSFGITKVNSSDKLKAAVEEAKKENCDVIIESFVKGIELSHGIYISDERVLDFPVTQIVSKNEFFDFEAKYEGKSDEITPAPITGELSGKVKKLTAVIAKRLGCKGLVRVDYIYSDNQLYFLEINTVPGMSEASIIPQQIVHAGYTVSQVLVWLIDDFITVKNN